MPEFENLEPFLDPRDQGRVLPVAPHHEVAHEYRPRGSVPLSRARVREVLRPAEVTLTEEERICANEMERAFKAALRAEKKGRPGGSRGLSLWARWTRVIRRWLGREAPPPPRRRPPKESRRNPVPGRSRPGKDGSPPAKGKGPRPRPDRSAKGEQTDVAPPSRGGKGPRKRSRKKASGPHSRPSSEPSGKATGDARRPAAEGASPGDEAGRGQRSRRRRSRRGGGGQQRSQPPPKPPKSSSND